MKSQKTLIALAAIALFAAAPAVIPSTAQAAPTVSFKAPAAGATISQPAACEVTGERIQRVVFSIKRDNEGSWTTLTTDQSGPWRCNIDPSRFANGDYWLRAVAYDRDSGGASDTATRAIKISRGTNNKAPSVSIMKPAASATLSAPVSGSGCQANAADSDGSVKRVDFFLSKSGTSTPVGSKTAAPYQCAINTANFANGSYTLMAVATDDKGAVASAQRALSISNPTSGGGGTNPINPAHILTRASADAPFSQQNGYTAQVISTYTDANQIAESGIHGSTLPNGETMRFGKTVDPRNSALKALKFQVRNSDPMTSNGKRAELAVEPNIEMNKVYWITFSAYVYDWGTLAANDNALFGTQMHTGDNQAHVGGPSFGIYTTQNGRMLRVHARYSESSNPSPSNSVSVKYAEHPIPFHRWTDFVLKFKHNTNGNGFLQVWMDGEMIANHQGSLGYNTGMPDYAKFGYYNWSGAAMGPSPRKVLLRAPTIVADPSGSTYSADKVRTLLDAAH